MVTRFGAFSLDTAARELRLGDRPVHLSPKAFDLLALLVSRRPAAVAKTDIQERLWPRTFVSETNLAVLVAEVRAVLGDDARRPQFIRTVHRFGYAFAAAATMAARPAMSRATCWLLWGQTRIPLAAGDNVLGRDPDAAVCIDAAGVSRRHANIVLTDDVATLHDLSSKNGTYVDDVRITSPTVLADRTELRLGPVELAFRRQSAPATTETASGARV